MSCEFDKDRLRALAHGSIAGEERESVLAHVDRCEDCRAALRGAEALAELAARDTGTPPAGLFEAVVEKAVSQPARAPRDNRFWMGAGFGAIAASLLAVALFFGWTDNFEPTASVPEFVVSLEEPRQMNLAFETDRVLDGATITIVLSGSVEIDGYGARRELSWTEDLAAGVNRLSLPVIANGFEGGQMVVRLEHPQSEQVFVVRLQVES
ncbi:MAG: zf-HC2 domain-containing protein [Gammaproteobacteria bacterium]|nr:zf-HC2 domain-containing protein [Gammaproteobacteria bacterium]